MPRDDERPYGIDDLVAHEKGQMRLVLLVMIVAMIYFAGQRLVGPPGEPASPGTAPVGSGT